MNKKDKRNKGREEARLLGKNSIDIEEAIEPTMYWDDWADYRDGFRNGKDRTHLYKGVPMCYDKEKINKINNKIKNQIRIRKLKKRLK